MEIVSVDFVKTILTEVDSMWLIIGVFVLLVGSSALVIASTRFYQPQLKPKLDNDAKNAKPRKISHAKIAERSAGQYVVFGECTETRDPVIQTDKERMMNTLFIGPNGVGKTSHLVSTAIEQDIKRGDNAVVIFEGQNDRRLVGTIEHLCEKYGRELKIFPNMGGYNALGIGEDAAERASLYGDILSLASQGGEGNKFYIEQQQAFINAVVPLYEHAYGQKMIEEELRKLCVSKEYRDRLLKDGTPSREATNYKDVFGGYRPQDFLEKLSGLSAFISNRYIGGGVTGRAELYNQRNAESLSEAIDRKCVIIVREGGARNTGDHALGILYLTELMRYVKERNTKHLVCLYLDELHFFLSPSFASFHATSRKKGVAQYLGIQSLGQLAIFGDEIAESIRDNSRTWIVHNGLKYKSAFEIANDIGQRPHIVYGESGQIGVSDAERSQSVRLEDKYLWSPSDIQNIDKHNVLYISIEDMGVAPTRLVKKPPIIDDSKFWYTPPKYSNYPPLTIWEEQDDQSLHP